MLKIWGRKSSSNVEKVLWLAEELGLQYQHISVGGTAGMLDTPEFLELNPHSRIPVIEDQEIVVWESHAILRYLAACYGQGTFWLEDPKRRAKIDSWMDWIQTTLQPEIMYGIFIEMYRPVNGKTNWETVHKNVATCSTHMQLLEQTIAGQNYLCGNSLSLADIPLGVLLYRYFTCEIDRPRLPNIEAYYQRLQGHTAYCEQIMLPWDDLKGRVG